MDLAACQTNQIFGNSFLSKKIEKLDGLPGPKVIKLFFMLSSAETKIYPAHKC